MAPSGRGTNSIFHDRENKLEVHVCNDLELHFSTDSKELCDELEAMWKSCGHTITRLEKAKQGLNDAGELCNDYSCFIDSCHGCPVLVLG